MAAVVAMSIVDDVVEFACQGLFVERVVRRTWRVVVQRVSEAGRGGRGYESSHRSWREKMRVRVDDDDESVLECKGLIHKW